MREKYESLAVAVLRDLAKARGLKGTSTMKKSEIVEAMLAEDEREKANAENKETPVKKETSTTEEKKENITYTTNRENNQPTAVREEMSDLDSGQVADGILEIKPGDAFGFIRSDNYLPGDKDIYVSPQLCRRFNLKTGDIVRGNIKVNTGTEKYSALLYVSAVNGMNPMEAQRRPNFEDLTPIFPNQRIHLERPGASVAMRVVDLVSPIG